MYGHLESSQYWDALVSPSPLDSVAADVFPSPAVQYNNTCIYVFPFSIMVLHKRLSRKPPGKV